MRRVSPSHAPRRLRSPLEIVLGVFLHLQVRLAPTAALVLALCKDQAIATVASAHECLRALETEGVIHLLQRSASDVPEEERELCPAGDAIGLLLAVAALKITLEKAREIILLAQIPADVHRPAPAEAPLETIAATARGGRRGRTGRSKLLGIAAPVIKDCGPVALNA